MSAAVVLELTENQKQIVDLFVRANQADACDIWNRCQEHGDKKYEIWVASNKDMALWSVGLLTHMAAACDAARLRHFGKFVEIREPSPPSAEKKSNKKT